MQIKKMKITIGIILLIILCISFVGAETLTGDLSSAPYFAQTGYTFTQNAATGLASDVHGYITHPELLTGLTTIIRYDDQGYISSYSAGAPAGASTGFTCYLGNTGSGTILFTGTYGYQRIFNALGIEQPGYQYWIIDNFDTGMAGRSGTIEFSMVYSGGSPGGLFWTTRSSQDSPSNQATGVVMFSTYNYATYNTGFGKFTLSRQQQFFNSYKVIKPSGLGMTGIINKTILSSIYPSKAFVFSPTGGIIVSDSAVNNVDFTFNIVNSSVKLGVLDGAGSFYNSSVLFASSSSGYTISIPSKNVQLNSGTSGIIVPPTNDFTAISAFRWVINNADATVTDFYESNSTTKRLNYVLKNATWYGWDTSTNDFTNNKGGSIPSTVSLIPSYSGNLTVTCYIYLNDGSMQSPTSYIIVGASQNLQKLTLLAEDSFTGALISPSTFAIKNLITGQWNNGTEIRNGQYDAVYSIGTPLYIEVVAAGWAKSTLTRTLQPVFEYNPDAVINWVIPMYTSSSSDINYTALFVAVTKNVDFTPLAGVTVKVSNSGWYSGTNDQYLQTGSSGIAQFNVTNGSPIYITAQLSGYNDGQKYILPTGSTYQTGIMLVAVGATPTPTFPPLGYTTAPTGIITPNPTFNTGTNNQSQLVGWFRAQLAENGIDSALSQNAILGLLLILLCAAGLGSTKAGSTGALVGAIVGFGISIYLDLIPFWVMAFVILVCGIVYVGFISKNTGG